MEIDDVKNIVNSICPELIVARSEISNSHNKIYICNNEDWQNSIHISIFDNILDKKYPEGDYIISIDSGKNTIQSNKRKIEEYRDIFINNRFKFDELDSGFVVEVLNAQEIDKLSAVIKIVNDNIFQN